MRIEDTEASKCDWRMEEIFAGVNTGQKEWYCYEHQNFSGNNHPVFPFDFGKDLYDMRVTTKTDAWDFRPRVLLGFVSRLLRKEYLKGQQEARTHYYERVIQDAIEQERKDINQKFLEKAVLITSGLKGDIWQITKQEWNEIIKGREY